MIAKEQAQPITRAIIYCRVSSARQKEEGHGLESQEHRCRQYAQLHGYEVEAVFPDDASGGGDFMKRPGMVALLSYLDAKPNENFVIIFDDLKRFARDREFHFKLKAALSARAKPALFRTSGSERKYTSVLFTRCRNSSVFPSTVQVFAPVHSWVK